MESNQSLSKENKKSKTIPIKDHMPGKGGNKAIFICPKCGNRFVRTMENQSICTLCMEKDQS